MKQWVYKNVEEKRESLEGVFNAFPMSKNYLLYVKANETGPITEEECNIIRSFLMSEIEELFDDKLKRDLLGVLE